MPIFSNFHLPCFLVEGHWEDWTSLHPTIALANKATSVFPDLIDTNQKNTQKSQEDKFTSL